VKALVALWDSYVRTNNVVSESFPFETLEDNLPPRVRTTRLPAAYYKRQFVPPRHGGDPKP